MNRDYFRGLSCADKLWHVASNPNAAKFAFERLKLHRAAAITQMSRIWEAVDRSRVPSLDLQGRSTHDEVMAYMHEVKERMVPVLFEIHFYFVAWSNCGHMMTVITGDRAFVQAKKVFDSHKKTFEHYAHGRNSFEHFHDRLPGRPDAEKVKELQRTAIGPRRAYFGLEGKEYKHSDKSWDISPDSLALLNKAIDEVMAVVNQTIDEIIEVKFSS